MVRPRVDQAPQELLNYVAGVVQRNGGPDRQLSERCFGGAAGWTRFHQTILDMLGGNSIAYPVAWDNNLRDPSFNRWRKELVRRVKNDLRGRSQAIAQAARQNSQATRDRTRQVARLLHEHYLSGLAIMTFTSLFAAALLRGFIMQPNPIMMIIRIGLQHYNPGGLIRLGVPSLSQVVITEITTLYHMITNLNINAFYTGSPFLNPHVQLQRANEGLSLWGRSSSNIGHSPTSQMYQDREAQGSTSPRTMTAGHVMNQLLGMIIPGVVVTSQYIARCMENLFHGVILGGLERGPHVNMNVPNGVVLSSALSSLCFGGLGSDVANGEAYFVGLAVAVGINGNEDYEGRLSGLHTFTELATRHLPEQAPPRSLDEQASQHVFSGQETTQAIRQLHPAIPEVPADMAGSVMSYDENESVPMGAIVYGDERVPTAAQAPVAPQAAAAAAQGAPAVQGAPAPIHVAAAAAQPPVAAAAQAAPQAAVVQQAHVAPPAQQPRRRGDIRNFFGGV